MVELKDAFQQTINEGAVVCYAARMGTKQLISFGVVMKIDSTPHQKFDLTLRTLDQDYLKMGQFKLRANDNRVNASQVWVLNNHRDMLPQKMIAVLEKGLEDFRIRQELQHRKSINRLQEKLTPGQRFEQNMQKVLEDRKIQVMLDA